MDLLKDDWIPVRENGTGPMQWISYKQLLCEDGGWQISLPRDDLEMACLQLLVSLTQVIFLPRDINELRERIASPLTKALFDQAIEPFADYFNLSHPDTPFMQINKTGAKKTTPIQKLFPGMPEGNNHAFFNEPGEIAHICPGCAAIALFNQNSNSPNFSGKHKGGLRGGAPITTLVFDADLRRRIWNNVLIQERVDSLHLSDNNQPVWIEPIKAGEKIQASHIGLLRGLFWVPILIRLQQGESDANCDVCGRETEVSYDSFWLGADFKFEVKGTWPHPHSPLNSSFDKGELVSKFSSFTTTVPAWTKFTEFMVEKNVNQAQEGHRPALPVCQYPDVKSGEGISLMIGGYRNKQASILERRHELHSLSAGWREGVAQLEKVISLAVEAKELLRKRLAYVSMGDKDKNLQGVGVPIQKHAVELFYQETESLMYGLLKKMNWSQRREAQSSLAGELYTICLDIYDRQTEPFCHKPELMPIIALGRRGLGNKLHEMKQGVSGNAA